MDLGDRMSSLRQRALQGLKAGDTLSVTRTFSRAETEAFGDLTRDYNPVHYESSFAATKGFDRLILHGLLTGGMVCEIGGQVAWLATDMAFKFHQAVYFGDTITCTVTITELDENGWAKADAIYTNQHGQVVVSGKLGGQVPMGSSRQTLAQMVERGDHTNKLAR